MKIVINSDYGGFSLSSIAIQRIAELQGRPCFLFTHELQSGKYSPLQKDDSSLLFFAFDIPNPNEVFEHREWHTLTQAERKTSNALHEKHSINHFACDRSHPVLVQVVEELGSAANGRFASLKIIEIPDDIKWQIEEYDGCEWVAEQHRTWQ